MIERLHDLAERYSKLLSVLSGFWLALSCASFAGFVSLPTLPVVSGWSGIAISGLWNSIWWGYFYPRAEERRASRSAQELTDG